MSRAAVVVVVDSKVQGREDPTEEANKPRRISLSVNPNQHFSLSSVCYDDVALAVHDRVGPSVVSSSEQLSNLH